MSQRAFYSVDDAVLAKFNRLVPASKRSHVISELMAKHVASSESALERAARLIENDLSYKSIHDDSALLSFESLIRLENNE